MPPDWAVFLFAEMGGSCCRSRNHSISAGKRPAMTTVSDVVYRADGSLAKGTVLISWPAFTTADGKAVAAGALNAQLGNGGTFSANLAPNTGALPAGVYYKVVHQLVDDGMQPAWDSEYRVVSDDLPAPDVPG